MRVGISALPHARLSRGFWKIPCVVAGKRLDDRARLAARCDPRREATMQRRSTAAAPRQSQSSRVDSVVANPLARPNTSVAHLADVADVADRAHRWVKRAHKPPG